MGCCAMLLMALGAVQAGDLAHSSRNALDWAGIYLGEIPSAADALSQGSGSEPASIKMLVRLEQDGAMEVVTVPLEASGEREVLQGVLEWDEAGQRVTLVDGAQAVPQFFVEENALVVVDASGERGDAARAAAHRLRKLTEEEELLVGGKWRLIELRGEAVPEFEGERYPYLEVLLPEARVAGFAGCNRLMGGVALEPMMRLKFSPLATTMMACDQLEFEREFLSVFEQVDSYAMDPTEQILSLHRARMAPLARFALVTDPENGSHEEE